MNLKQRLAFWLLKAADMGGWNVLSWMQGRPYYPDVSYQGLIKKYQGWVYTCANKNAVSCAQIPLGLYSTKPSRKSKALFKTRAVSAEKHKYLLNSPSVGRKAIGDVEEVLEHPFLDLMYNVNEFTNRFDLLEGTFLAMELTGNAYWQVVMDGLQLPQEIWPRQPQYIKIIPSKESFISHYEYAVSSAEKHNIKTKEMVHFKYVNPKSAFYGMGPLEAACIAADLGIGMNEFEMGLMNNRGNPEWALVLPADAGEPSENEQKRMERLFRQRHAGNKKAGGLKVITGGAELKQLTLSPREMNFLQGRKWNLNEIAGVYGVPMSKVTTESVNRANAEAGDYSYMKDTVLPRTRKVEQKINEQLLPMYDDNLFCAFENPVPEDKEFRLKQAESRLKTGQTTINEERQQDGQEPVSWGEVEFSAVGFWFIRRKSTSTG
jgi:HK97 family phage portal protein